MNVGHDVRGRILTRKRDEIESLIASYGQKIESAKRELLSVNQVLRLRRVPIANNLEAMKVALATRGIGFAFAAEDGHSVASEEFDEDQNVRRSPLGREVVSAARTMTPNTWYTRLAVDRLLWDKLQTLVDLDDREGHAGAAAGQRSCVERDMLAKRAMG